jgi:ribosomal protein S18 acetylase RimI-like enzyme
VIRIEVDPLPSAAALDELWQAAWGTAAGNYAARVLTRSLAHLGAFDDERLVGFVNVAWDGGIHAFLLDTCVHPAFQRQGIATRLVRQATEIARSRGAFWLHVDFEQHLDGFYRGCGFRPTAAGLIKLK